MRFGKGQGCLEHLRYALPQISPPPLYFAVTLSSFHMPRLGFLLLNAQLPPGCGASPRNATSPSPPPFFQGVTQQVSHLSQGREDPLPFGVGRLT